MKRELPDIQADLEKEPVKKNDWGKNKNSLNITSESVLDSQKYYILTRKKIHSDLKVLMLILLLMVQMSLTYSYVIKDWKFPFPERDFTCFSLLELAQTQVQATENSIITA